MAWPPLYRRVGGIAVIVSGRGTVSTVPIDRIAGLHCRQCDHGGGWQAHLRACRSVVLATTTARAPLTSQPRGGWPAGLGRASRPGPPVIMMAIAAGALPRPVALRQGKRRRRFARQIAVVRAAPGRGASHWPSADFHRMKGARRGSAGRGRWRSPRTVSWLRHASTLAGRLPVACRRTATSLNPAASLASGRFAGQIEHDHFGLLPLASSSAASVMCIASPAASACPLTSSAPRATCT